MAFTFMINNFEKSIQYLPELPGKELVTLLSKMLTVAAMENDEKVSDKVLELAEVVSDEIEKRLEQGQAHKKQSEKLLRENAQLKAAQVDSKKSKIICGVTSKKPGFISSVELRKRAKKAGIPVTKRKKKVICQDFLEWLDRQPQVSSD